MMFDLLAGLALVTLAYFSTFDAPLARSLADDAGETEEFPAINGQTEDTAVTEKGTVPMLFGDSP